MKVAANDSVSSHSLPGAFGFVYIWVITTGRGVTVSGLLFEMRQLLFLFWGFFFSNCTEKLVHSRWALEGCRAPPDHTGGTECWTLHSPVGVLHSSALLDVALLDLWWVNQYWSVAVLLTVLVFMASMSWTSRIFMRELQNSLDTVLSVRS